MVLFSSKASWLKVETAPGALQQSRLVISGPFFFLSIFKNIESPTYLVKPKLSMVSRCFRFDHS